MAGITVILREDTPAKTERASDITDANGAYELNWSGTTPFWGRVYFYFEGSGLNVNDGSNVYRHWTAPLWVAHGTVTMGTHVTGTTTLPLAEGNIWSAAQRALARSISTMPGLVTKYSVTPIQIQYPGNCPTASYNDATSLVCVPLDIDDGSGNGPIGGPSRVAHELGHWSIDHVMADDNSNPCKLYDRNADPGWSLTEEEWGCDAYQEGSATFISDVSRYWSNTSAVADTCDAADYPVCGTLLEPSLATACIQDDPCPATPGARNWPLSVLRFLWDSYDTNADGACGPSSAPQSFFDLVMNQTNFAPGGGNGQRDEWASTAHRDDGPGPSSDDDGFQDGTGASDINEDRGTGTAVSNNRRDQSGAFDYWINYWDAHTVGLSSYHHNNCSPPGN